ncbi:MAG: DEAD/DEAH box helicase [Planctomycetota bacterium]|jgi:DEAD/DEAH box helicase domain-containing protein
MDADRFITDVQRDKRYRGQVVRVETLAAREAQYAEPAEPLCETLDSLLRRDHNIHQLYTHQAAALDAVAASKDVVIVTSTASGKTLCYNLPVIRTLLDEPDARAMYLFPTKALAQDQAGLLQKWAADPALAEALRPAVYDGDTPSHARTRIRNKASLILTNPDMLHVGILPYHGKWHEFLRNLKYVVVDEVHTYRGIFGSHVAGVLRRLFRLCEHYGSRPQVICSSATIANPVGLSSELTGREMTLIDSDGSPRGRKHFVLWNPPFVGEENVLRRSGNIEAVELLSRLVKENTQTIVFTRSRVAAELIYKYAADNLTHERATELAERIRPYRGGYLPTERREIEKALFSGELLGVVATNALELGIDVGALDAALLVGFPGTICSTWQQAGRAGRSSQDSLVVLIAYEDPIDQFLMRHPDYLFAASHEHAVVDPANPHILSGQLSCACFEKPLTDADEAYFGPLVRQVAEICAEDGEMKQIDDRYYWSSSEYPAKSTNLRVMGNDTYAIADITGQGGHRVIGQVDSISAPELVYPNAVYLHEGQSYVDYYTQPVLSSHCRLGEIDERRPWRGGELIFTPADVTWQTIAFKKIKYYTMEMVGQTELDLPSQTLPTTACGWDVGEVIRDGLSQGGFNPYQGLLGVRNLMLAALPSLAMCDRRDIGGIVDSSNLGVPVIVIYDRYPGGLGFAQKGYELTDTWLDICAEIVRGCPCRDGCPSCVGLANLRPAIHGDPDLGNTSAPVPDKNATILLLHLLEQAPAETPVDELTS